MLLFFHYSFFFLFLPYFFLILCLLVCLCLSFFSLFVTFFLPFFCLYLLYFFPCLFFSFSYYHFKVFFVAKGRRRITWWQRHQLHRNFRFTACVLNIENLRKKNCVNNNHETLSFIHLRNTSPYTGFTDGSRPEYLIDDGFVFRSHRVFHVNFRSTSTLVSARLHSQLASPECVHNFVIAHPPIAFSLKSYILVRKEPWSCFFFKFHIVQKP